MRIGLSQSALNRLMQEMRQVVARDDHRDQTHLWCNALLGRCVDGTRGLTICRVHYIIYAKQR